MESAAPWRRTTTSSGTFPPDVTIDLFQLGTGDGTSASVTLTGYDPVSKKLAGTFAATLKKAGGAETVTISGGKFLVALNDNQ